MRPFYLQSLTKTPLAFITLHRVGKLHYHTEAQTPKTKPQPQIQAPIETEIEQETPEFDPQGDPLSFLDLEEEEEQEQEPPQTPPLNQLKKRPEDHAPVEWRYRSKTNKGWISIVHNEFTLEFLDNKLTGLLPKFNVISSGTFRHFVNKHGRSKEHIQIILKHADFNGHLSDDLYNLCIFRLSKVLGKPQEALNLFFELRENRVPNLLKNSYTAALHAMLDIFGTRDYSKYSLQDMENLVQEIKERNLEMDISILRPILLGYLHFNKHDKVEEILSRFPQEKDINEYGKIYLSLASHYKANPEKIKRFYDEIQQMKGDQVKKKFEPKKKLSSIYRNKEGESENIHQACFNILLQAYADTNITQAQQLFDETIKNAANANQTPPSTPDQTTTKNANTNTNTNTNSIVIQPDHVSYSILFHKYIALAIDQHFLFSTHAERRGLNMKKHFTSDYFSKAMQLFKALLETPFEPRVQEYASILNASYKLQQFDDLFFVLDVLKQRNPEDFDTPEFAKWVGWFKKNQSFHRFNAVIHYFHERVKYPKLKRAPSEPELQQTKPENAT
eukprot:TRINITY_DN3142_c0_g1_i2.p1 TRINITY_DN3142_c0_g1~~TRINITY_DN3142_c0_g1_i2.p1  ORF type:complete len:560 (-),score=112.40 TRINITY_DN3142_c0_g1_i2:51-1730(-)